MADNITYLQSSAQCLSSFSPLLANDITCFGTCLEVPGSSLYTPQKVNNPLLISANRDTQRGREISSIDQEREEKKNMKSNNNEEDLWVENYQKGGRHKSRQEVHGNAEQRKLPCRYTSFDSEPVIYNNPLHSMARWFTAPHTLPRHTQQCPSSPSVLEKHTHTQTRTHAAMALWERS